MSPRNLSRNFSRNLKRIFIVSCALACGCTPAPPPQTQVEPAAEPRTLAGLQAVSPEPRGPYKTVELDGCEMRQGRFPDGTLGGTFTKLATAEPETFNPYATNDAYSWELGGILFRGLAQTDCYTGEVAPDLASQIKLLPDGVTYLVTLRKGLRWSDGKPLTAADVEFTWNTVIGKRYAVSSVREAALVDDKMPQAKAVDELTVRFTTPRPHAPFRRQLTNPVLPAHIVEPLISGPEGRRAFAELWSAKSRHESLTTSGAFTLTSYEPGVRIEFARRPDFYMINKSGVRLPYFDRVVYSKIQGSDSIVSRINSGDIDVAELRPRDVERLSDKIETSPYKLYSLGPSSATFFLVFNMTPPPASLEGGATPLVPPEKSAWFNDRNFRQAVNHLVSRRAMIDSYFKGLGFPIFSCIPSISPWFAKSIEPFAADIEKARSYFSYSQFRADPGTGILLDPKGNNVSFELLYPRSGALYELAAYSIKEQLKKVGISVNTRELDFSELTNRLEQTGKWEAALYSLTLDPVEPSNNDDVFKSNGCLHLFDVRSGNSDDTENRDREFEKQIDEIMDRAEREMDSEKRRELFNKLQETVYAESPFIYLVTGTSIVACRKSVGNFEPVPLSQSVQGLHNLEELYRLPEVSGR